MKTLLGHASTNGLSLTNRSLIADAVPPSQLFAIRIRQPLRVLGFTLIELSVVVVIIAMILTMGLTALNAQLVSAGYGETKRRQALVKDALIAYLGANKRLPCPDVPNNTNGTADDAAQINGAEDRAGGVVTGACIDSDGDGTALGVVPYATLGLGRDAALDGWRNFMTYRLAIASPAPACPGNGIDWSRTVCFGSGKSGSLSIYEGFVASPSEVANGVIAAIVSHGPNGLGAWAQQGSRNAAPASCEETHNALTAVAGCAITPGRLYKGERPENDDVVGFLSASEATTTLVKNGEVQSVTAQVIDDLGVLMDDALGIVLLNGCEYAKSGETSPGTPRAATPVLQDPWGYTYRIRDNIKFKGVDDDGLTLTPGATAALCFYSLGPGAAGTINTETCVASNGAAAKGISETAIEGYLAKAGKPNC